MKKIFMIIVSLFIIIGCTNQEDTIKKDYYKYLDQVIEAKDTNSKLDYKVIVNKTEHTYHKYLYEIIISNPTKQLSNLKVIALPEGYNFDEIAPTFNILEKVDITSFNNKETSIKLNYFSDEDYLKFKILFDDNTSIKVKSFKTIKTP